MTKIVNLELEKLKKLRNEMVGDGGLSDRYQEFLCTEEEGPLDLAYCQFLWQIDKRIRAIVNERAEL